MLCTGRAAVDSTGAADYGSSQTTTTIVKHRVEVNMRMSEIILVADKTSVKMEQAIWTSKLS